MEAREREGAHDGEVPLEAFGSGAEEAVGRGFTGSIWMQRVDGITFAARAVLLTVNQAGADMDEVAAIDLAGGFKERYGGGDIETDEIEPADL